VASLPIDARTGATTYYKDNSGIASENVLAVVVGKNTRRWFGTDKGISAFFDDKWLTPSYQRKYPEAQFKDYPITAMATSPDGDSLYVATEGAGVARVYRNEVDAISGASEYAQWGPIDLPSDKVYSICVTSDGTQWFGTDKGLARHSGYKTLENWTVFNTENGLIDNFVQSIVADKDGRLWVGTKAGISIYDGQSWTSLTEKDGLLSNNIRLLKVDLGGVVWIGSDKAIYSYEKGNLCWYK
jgi:ligand-binding sensor domain-containing protein